MKTQLLTDIFQAALFTVDPYRAVSSGLRRTGNTLYAGAAGYELNAFDRVVVIGAGKAAGRMAEAVESVLNDVALSGAVVVKRGRTARLRSIEQIEAGHPIPDEAGIRGTRRILDILRSVDAKTLVLCLLSGGASALLVDPLPGISLEDKQKSIDLLLRSGASVYQLNTVMKHLSGVKGGRLARAAYPATVLTLTLSDVIGDRIDVIGSGPTAPGNASFRDAARVIEKLQLRYKLPESIVAFLEQGARGGKPGPAESREACFFRTRNVIVGGMAQALFSAGGRAGQAGYVPQVSIGDDRGGARGIARVLAKKALRVRDVLERGERRCLVIGRESPEAGRGRRAPNHDMALAFADEVSGIPGIALVSAATHGTDGSADAAGAMVDWTTAAFARSHGISPDAYLRNNDSCTFFSRLDAVSAGVHQVRTGPTGANRIDVQAILVEG